MTIIAVDGLSEEAFRRSIESRLRRGLAKEATAKLRALLAPYAGPGGILPGRFLKVLSGDLNLVGWEKLGDALVRHDQPDRAVTAISIAFGWPGEDPPQPDPYRCLAPQIETSFFTDEAFPFSQSSREDLLDGYSYHGCNWADEVVATEPLLALEGVDDLHGALVELETRLLGCDEPAPEEIRAGSLGACLLSALLFQAVGERIASDGLPRPLCVLSGSNGVYPYFDAPVAGMPEDVLRNEELRSQVPAPRYSSLLVTGIPRAKKRAVLVLDETDSERELRTADLRNLAHGAGAAPSEPMSAPAPEEAPLPPEGGIIPISNGPLMVKKKPSESWDFRDMLSSPEPEEPEEPEAPEVPEPEPPVLELFDPAEPEPPEFDQPEPEPFSPPLVQRYSPAAEPVPGFTLLDSSVQDRLDALVALSQPPLDETFVPELLLEEPFAEEPFAEEPLAEEPVAEEPVAEALTAEPEPTTLPEGPVWCFGIGYLEDAAEADACAEDQPLLVDEAPSGLWARLRRWLKRP